MLTKISQLRGVQKGLVSAIGMNWEIMPLTSDTGVDSGGSDVILLR